MILNRTVAASVAVGLSATILAAAGPSPATTDAGRTGPLKRCLIAALDARLQEPAYQNLDISIRICKVDGEKILYERTPEKALIPASAIKAITSGISLSAFGPEFRFQTRVAATGDLRDGVLEGDLYLVGKGDPCLSLSHLEKAARQLREAGIKDLAGDIVYDVGFLDEEKPRYPPNARHLYAPPSALTVNYNWIILELEQGPPPTLEMNPLSAYGTLDYKITLSPSTRPGKPEMTYKETARGDDYRVRGTVTEWDRRYEYLRVGVSRPGLFGATLFQEACRRAGIKTEGTIRKGTAPGDAKTVFMIETAPLKDAIRVLNQESNNVVAELINKDVGAHFGSIPGTREKGLAVMRRYCSEKIGLDNSRFVLDDASGLSVKNRFSAAQFTQALNHFYRQAGAAYVETLAPQGHHPHAMVPVPPEGIRMFAKSGTLPSTGVNTSVGYVFMDGANEAYSYAILINRRAKGPPAYSGTFTNPLLIAMVDAFKKTLR